ncbi:MAG: tRNA (adenosine(37)-N6)-threonylcarbamoyltransferase complex ATPase subunit type 1 TsaE [Minisyncoccota bacterium]
MNNVSEKKKLHILEETKAFAVDFVKTLSPQENKATVLGLYGDLGAGKTSFTQGLASALGIIDTVVSPTFVIEKIYTLENQKFSHLIHIDAYRIEKSEEMLHLGWEEIISNPDNLIVVEWPELITDIMPSHVQIKLAHITENERVVEVVNFKF